MNIIKAHIRDTPEQFIKKNLNLSIYAGIGFSILSFFLFDKFDINLIYILPVFLFFLAGSFIFFLESPKALIRKREKEIDKEVLFAGRYLLVKIESGVPLFNALTEASKSYGICSKYFKEIVDDINLGVPIEKALDLAREYNSSENFKLILSELVTILKTGADVVPSLKAVLDQIRREQVIEIKAYGKKLNAFMMLYLVVAAVFPSLGMTMFTIFAGFISFNLTYSFVFIIIFLLVVIQLFFIGLFKQIRPTVNL